MPKIEEYRYLSQKFDYAAPSNRQNDVWLLRFEEDRNYLTFDNADDAWAAWNQHAPSWNCYLFRVERLAAHQPATQPVDVEDVVKQLLRHMERLLGRAITKALTEGKAL